MEEARGNPALQDHVAAFLEDQRSLIAIQKHHLNAQFRQILLGTWEKRLSVLLRLATLVVGIGVAAALGLMLWQAARSHGLVVETFAVPPELAARGLSSEVVASQMLDKLTALQSATDSSRAPQSYANNWGNNLKVEIPETGVSLGELQRFLKEWLGHDTRIRGEVFRTATGIAVTARTGAETGATFAGPESEFDALMQKAAESVYEITQPYRYANYLDRNPDPNGLADRRARAAAIYERLLQSPDPQERAWALNGLGTQSYPPNGKGTRFAISYYRQAIATWPDFTVGHFAVAAQEALIGRREIMLADLRAAARLLEARTMSDVNPRLLPNLRANTAGLIAVLTGDFEGHARHAQTRVDLRLVIANQNWRGGQVDVATALALRHDWRGARAALRDLDISSGVGPLSVIRLSVALEDWQAVVRARNSTSLSHASILANFTAALSPVALAMAHLGDMAGAEAEIADTPADCDECLLVRARIAQMQGQRARADFWFARATAAAPSIPFAEEAWGRSLLARGDADAAIEKFKLSSQKGPKFADPLQGWGEALMAKNQSHLALAKFAEAEKFAPNWGRLHLKWGQALVYAGKADEAKTKFARAATLDLTPTEKAELARQP